MSIEGSEPRRYVLKAGLALLAGCFSARPRQIAADE